ncbi:hypothetical protein PFICI_03445 [Pestalotiopsis fici W106-1]|uniref:Uncharacterized protein n=1 Tax=Pestalotiopsis fici (strain W106-1 / CGMCC3.15140) TaxID=1229662 RepID=W3XHA9_PESFW|nr:uncharacterized protein PFICI_03445 [Pestalotiopsis fici W106-1]ETS85420.1 hypothetical protein PFICI_03445 [Pestalotiopsis fici W106-1]
MSSHVDDRLRSPHDMNALPQDHSLGGNAANVEGSSTTTPNQGHKHRPRRMPARRRRGSSSHGMILDLATDCEERADPSHETQDESALDQPGFAPASFEYTGLDPDYVTAYQPTPPHSGRDGDDVPRTWHIEHAVVARPALQSPEQSVNNNTQVEIPMNTRVPATHRHVPHAPEESNPTSVPVSTTPMGHALENRAFSASPTSPYATMPNYMSADDGWYSEPEPAPRETDNDAPHVQLDHHAVVTIRLRFDDDEQ